MRDLCWEQTARHKHLGFNKWIERKKRLPQFISGKWKKSKNISLNEKRCLIGENFCVNVPAKSRSQLKEISNCRETKKYTFHTLLRTKS